MSDTGIEEQNELKHFLDTLLQKRNLRGDVVFSSVAGSHSFNLSVATSDRDYFGVYAGHINDVLSLIPPPESFDSHEPDYTVYEILMFCKLVLKGNPKLIEPLFSTHHCYGSEDWTALQQVRNSFLSKSVVKHYISYALSQLKDAKKGEGVKTKKYYHVLRLLREAERMCDGGTPKVWIDGEERDFLLSIRKGELDENFLVERVAEMQARVEEKLKTANLPETADPAPLNDWLISIRRKNINENTQEKLEIKPTNESPESLAMRDKAQSAMTKSGISGTVLYYGPSGSTLHGFFQGGLEDSICVYASPTNSFVSLNPPPQKVILDEEKTFQSDTYTKGMMLFEVSYALSLLSQGNHRMNELIWAKPSTPFYSTNAWDDLVSLAAPKLLTSHALKHYYGIARGAVENLAVEFEGKTAKPKPNKKVQPPNKVLYHSFRCLWCAQSIAQQEIPQIGMERDRALLQRLRNNEGDVKEMYVAAKALVSDTQKLVENAKLPDFDRETIGKWLVNLRKSL